MFLSYTEEYIFLLWTLNLICTFPLIFMIPRLFRMLRWNSANNIMTVWLWYSFLLVGLVAILRKMLILVDFTDLLLQNSGQVVFIEREKKQTNKKMHLSSFRQNKQTKKKKKRQQKETTFSDQELTGIWGTLCYLSPLQPKTPAVIDYSPQRKWVQNTTGCDFIESYSDSSCLGFLFPIVMKFLKKDSHCFTPFKHLFSEGITSISAVLLLAHINLLSLSQQCSWWLLYKPKKITKTFPFRKNPLFQPWISSVSKNYFCWPVSESSLSAIWYSRRT